MITDTEAPLDAVIVTAELETRPASPADANAMVDVLAALAEEMGQPSRHVLQRVAEVACVLCRAGSSGVSILEQVDGKPRFRWHGLAGELREHLWDVTPRDASPAGVVVTRRSPQLFRHPERHFRYFAEMKPRIVEALLVPVLVNDVATGALWIMAHDTERQFDREDVRVVGELAKVAGAAVRANAMIDGLRASNLRKDEFLTMLSHEMRNPLAAMSNAVKYLTLTGAHDADQERARAVIQRQLTQITRLSEDLLDVSRVGRGTLELRTEPTDLTDAVRLGREAATPALAEYDRGIEIVVPEEPVWVEGDPARLAQVVTNLLTNATRRTRSGGLASLTLTRDGDEAVLLVSSDTESVAAGWAAPAIDPFAPPPATLSASEQQGIGLALARSLTEMHGGRVATVSVGGRQDNGFEARFPLRESGEYIAVERHDGRGDRDRVRERRRRERVLIVDDCVDSSDSLAMLLRSWGHEVRTAQGATAGLRLEWEFEPHAVILDIEMPGKNGYEVAAELRVRRRRDLMLVALSGHAREEDRARSLAAGFDHHLTKPANVEMLRRLLA